MAFVHRLPLAILAVLLVPAATADEPSTAPALWTDLYGDQGVTGVEIAPGGAVAGEQFTGTISFSADYAVADVAYQICEIGNACFAAGLPLTQQGTTWSFDTTDIPDHVPTWSSPYDFEAGTRIGIQFFVCMDNGTACPDNVFEWRHFPEGFDQDHPTWDDDFVAWSESHYFGIDIAPAAKTTPGPGLLLIVAAIGLAARRR